MKEKDIDIKLLLISVLRVLSEATFDMESYDTDCGILHSPNFRYMPIFEFSDEDIKIIKRLAKEEGEDFSTLIKQ